MKRKRIILGYDFLKEMGGLERVMFFQANSLYVNYDLELVFSYISDIKAKQITKELNLNKNIKISQLSRLKNENFQFIISLLNPKRILRKEADLIISHSFMFSNMALAKKKKDGTPYIVNLYHPPNFLYNANLRWANNIPRKIAFVLGKMFWPILRNIDKKAVKNADKVIAISEYTAKRVRDIYGIIPIIIYPALSKDFKIISKYKSEKLLNKLNIKRPYLFLHGRIIKDKRPDMAIMAFAKVLKENDINLVISGTIEEELKIKELIDSLGIKGNVRIIGRVSNEELVALYNSAKCFLMSAPKEDFGLTPIEAMACGCPVVAWADNAGPQETIINGKTGYLAKPYSIGDFANKIKLCINKKFDKKDISKSVLKFSENKIKKDFLEVIREFI